jgi:tetratricopeptide (TPR) repeat protein/tRNA A-37 threonylcarbamoyl transferase component Bud32
LVDRSALDDARRALLEALVAEHLKQQGGDPVTSLAAINSLGSGRQDRQRLDDADLQAGLAATAYRPAGEGGDDGTTAAYTPVSLRAGERFRILRFHRQGGLGRVYVARDEELGREVALKEIRPDKVAEAHLRTRFVLEAEINGGLEHPGIVPVYSLGAYDDGRPYYAMRLVEGESLREAIQSYHKASPRPDPTAVEFRKLLGRFIDVCEAIAFAHSKGVLHRDLKPHNVMLGRFGETLLIDWGLAKATGRREPVSPDAACEATLVPPSGSGHALTLGVLGSPSYMSPEQAAGESASLGPATDVYGLGAILFALLTGEPPVEGKTTQETLDRVRRGAIRALQSLNPKIPRALEAVCQKALALTPADRYPTALALAEDVERWLADEPVSAWREPWIMRAARWGRQHRTPLAAGAAAILVAAALGGGIGSWLYRQHQHRMRELENTVARIQVLHDRAARAGDLAAWREARAAAEPVAGALGDLRASAQGRRLLNLVDAIGREARLAEDDRALIAELTDHRSAGVDLRGDVVAAGYASIFRRRGLDPLGRDAGAVTARLTGRPAAVKREVVNALDQWALTIRQLKTDPDRLDAVLRLARALDPDPERDRLRADLRRPDLKAGLETFRRMAQSPDLSVATVLLLAQVLIQASDTKTAIVLLRHAAARYPQEPWIDYELAGCLDDGSQSRKEEAIRFYSAARALRPELAYRLGAGLMNQGRYPEAIDVLQELVRRRPDVARFRTELAIVLRLQGEVALSATELNEAVELTRREIRARPADDLAHQDLGFLLDIQGKRVEALAEFREAARLRPDLAAWH